MNVHHIIRTPEDNSKLDVQVKLLSSDIAGTVRFMAPIDWAIEEPVRFEVLSPVVAVTDFPLPDRAVPLYSARFAKALTDLGGFEYRTYSVHLMDKDQQPLGTGQEFVLFHVRTTVDLMDYERSEYDVYPPTDTLLAGKPRLIKKFALREDAKPPPCFYLEHMEQYGPIVSDAGRAALEKLPPLGLSFVPLPRLYKPPKAD